MENKIIDTNLLIYIIIATLAGLISRWSLLKVDYRQYPSYPSGYLIHLIVGFIASASGAIVVPSLIRSDFTAVTFFFLAIQQFREVRKMERDSLTAVDKSEFFPRGEPYIDGISKSFESRNYIAMIISFITTIILIIIPQQINIYIKIIIALTAAIIVHLSISKFLKGYSVKDIATVKIGQISFRDNNLYVDDVYIMNIGLDAAKERLTNNGIAVVLIPKGMNESIQLNNAGQRQAIIHECSRFLGLERFVENKREFNTGAVALILVPIRKEPETLIRIIENVPLLEIVRKHASVLKVKDNE